MFNDKKIASQIRSMEQTFELLQEAKKSGNTDEYEGQLLDLKSELRSVIDMVSHWKEINE